MILLTATPLERKCSMNSSILGAIWPDLSLFFRTVSTAKEEMSVVSFLRSMHTEAINHDPAITFFQTGSQIAGRPSIGAWLSLRPGQREPEPAGVRGR